jgi:hypothetical protein
MRQLLVTMTVAAAVLAAPAAAPGAEAPAQKQGVQGEPRQAAGKPVPVTAGGGASVPGASGAPSTAAAPPSNGGEAPLKFNPKKAQQ